LTAQVPSSAFPLPAALSMKYTSLFPAMVPAVAVRGANVIL